MHEVPRRLVGHRFPGGSVRIEPYVDLLVREMVGAEPVGAGSGNGTAHPTVAFLAATDGLGVGLAELFALFGSSAEDGPMLGEWAVEFARPLRCDTGYDVRAQVEDVRRRSGGSGTFDLACVRIELLGPDARVHATVRPTYVFPRRAG